MLQWRGRLQKKDYMCVAEEDDFRGNQSANWVTHSGCDRKNPVRDEREVPQLRKAMGLRDSESRTLN